MSVPTSTPARDRLPLSPTPRTTVRRSRERARSDRQALYEVLDTALICHLGLLVDGVPTVLPTAFAADLDGPDEGGTLYLHGSVAARSLQSAPAQDICVAVTVLDGLVLARSGFHHSMNYRSAVVMGRPRQVIAPAEQRGALDRIVNHLVPGRVEALRRPTRKELAATAVIALGLAEASVKVRSGDPVDDQADIEQGGWAGVIPLRLAAGDIVTSTDAVVDDPPAHVRTRAAALA